MNHFDFSRIETKKIVFVWDRSNRFVSYVEKFVGMLSRVVVYSVHAMPHESIHSYGACKKPRDEMSSFERTLHREYEKAVSATQTLRNNSRLEVLFGDRIGEIARFAEVIKADFILTPRFGQASFSKWLHGDLNERIVRKATCPIVFLDDSVFLCDFSRSQTGLGYKSPEPSG